MSEIQIEIPEARSTIEMILVPAGTFMMGSNDGYSNEQPVHQVTITRSFYLGKYEVTQGQWEAVRGSNPSHFKGARNPVEQVSCDDCQEFAKMLNAQVPGGGFRLPMEAEWEYACRAGSTGRFCFGDDDVGLWEYAWDEGNSGGQTHPVGQKRPNAWGLHDMHGNVSEWCSDWYGESYRGWSPAADPPGLGSGGYRAYRGGSWLHDAVYC